MGGPRFFTVGYFIRIIKFISKNNSNLTVISGATLVNMVKIWHIIVANSYVNEWMLLLFGARLGLCSPLCLTTTKIWRERKIESGLTEEVIFVRFICESGVPPFFIIKKAVNKSCSSQAFNYGPLYVLTRVPKWICNLIQVNY